MPRSKHQLSAAPGDQFRLYTAEEVAALLHVPVSWLSAARKAGAPFPLGRTRPEWIHQWLRENPALTLKEYRDE